MKKNKGRVKQKNEEYQVKETSQLFDFLMENLKGRSRNNIKSLLTRKQILVNDIVVSQYNFELVKGDVIKVTPFRNTVTNKIKLPIIYEDDMLIVINKPTGLLSIASDKEKEATAYRYVNEYLRQENPNARAFVLHRLDKETSGILMFSKTPNLVNALHKNWNHFVTKRAYFVVIKGKIPQNSGVIKSYLHQSKTQQVYSGAKTKDAKYSETHYEFLRGNNEFSLYDVKLQTGRKNQIRVHFRDLGYPIIGDDKYNGETTKIKRLGLHAYEIVFKNPITKKIMSFKTPIPKEFNLLLK